MYLARMILNPRNRLVQRDLADPYALHCRLMKSFPSGLDRERDRVLFRAETDPRNGVPLVILQSTLEPRWAWLEDADMQNYLLRPPEHKAFELTLAEGQTLAFRLRANPTVKRKFKSGDHKRVGIYDEGQQIEWLKRKAELGGFGLVSVRLNRQPDVKRTIRRKGQSHSLKLAAVQFDGLLQVTNSDLLHRTVRQGIGSAKGFGFGLLSLAPPARG